MSCNQSRSALIIVCALFSATVFADEVSATCDQSAGSLPLEASHYDFFFAPEVPGGPSDLDIFTEEDFAFCPGLIGKRVSAKLDPHTLDDDGSVWRVGSNRWNDEHEKAFSKWVETEVGADFFRKFGISTDCADAALAVRVIYARIHHLPIRIDTGTKTHYVHTTKAYGNLKTVKNWDSKNWQTALQQDRRFRKFLDDANINVGTVNLPSSTYPVKIESCSRPGKLSEYVRAGTVLLSDGHARFISKIDTLEKISPIQEKSSTVPAAVRDLNEGDPSLYFISRDRGVLGFNWAVNCGKFTLVPDEKMPNFSLEQYSLFKGKQADRVLKEMTPGKRGFADRAHVDKKFKELKELLIRRVNLVNEAQEKLRGDPDYFKKNPDEVDHYSTPGLDTKIRMVRNELEYQCQLTVNPALVNYFKIRSDRFIIVTGKDRYLSLSDFLTLTEGRSVASDPSQPPESRWGFDNTEDLVAQIKMDLEFARKDREGDYQRLLIWDRARYKAGWLKLPADAEVARIEARLAELQKRGVRID